MTAVVAFAKKGIYSIRPWSGLIDLIRFLPAWPVGREVFVPNSPPSAPITEGLPKDLYRYFAICSMPTAADAVHCTLVAKFSMGNPGFFCLGRRGKGPGESEANKEEDLRSFLMVRLKMPPELLIKSEGVKK
jgi:hypothetical protein